MRLELEKRKDEEKLFDITKLNDLKDEEINNLKLIWQSKTNELLEEVI